MTKFLFIFLFSTLTVSAFSTEISSSIKPSVEDIVAKKYLSIVFASQNIKSPISMFGHTLLIAHNNLIPEPNAIIIEFLGKTENDAEKYFEAFFSGISGYYNLTFYQYKMREYDLENRDLWFYDLNLSPEARIKFNNRIDFFLKEEVEYNFTLKNCAYHVLNLLDLPENEDLFKKLKFYTLPIDTIRELKSQYLIKTGFYLPSTQKSLLFRYNKLTPVEQNKIVQALHGFRVETLPSDSKNFETTLSEAISYQIPREPNQNIRSHLFKLKVRYPHVNKVPQDQYVEKDPADTLGEASLSLGYDLSGNGFQLVYKPFLRDFFTSKNDGLEASYLEFLKVWIRAKNDKIAISQFNLFKIVSLVESSEFSENFNRYIDISFYDWTTLTVNRSSEIVARLGAGWSHRFGKNNFGILPYIGVRHSNYQDSARSGFDLGFRMILNHWVSDDLRFEESYLRYLNSPFDFNSILQFSAVYQINRSQSFGITWQSAENENKSESLAQLTFLF